jgi:hypothetical protein
MKKKSRKKSERPTQDEKQKCLENFSPEEREKIYQLVKDLKKIRQVDKNSEDIASQLDMIAEQQFYYFGDFIISEGWEKDRDRVSSLTKYLQLEFHK